MKDNIFYQLFEQLIIEATERQGVEGSKKTFEIGGRNEDFFDQVMKLNNIVSQSTSEHEDKRMHMDRKIYKMINNQIFGAISNKQGMKDTVEVKGRKHDEKGNLLVEIIGWTGHQGWLYSKSYFIAFDVPEAKKFIFFRTTDLINYIEKLGNFKTVRLQGMSDYTIKLNDGKPAQYTSNKNLAILPVFYKRGTVNDRGQVNKDVITQISLIDAIKALNPVKIAY